MVKADLHNHLRTSSRCLEADFNRAVDKASKRLGNNGILGVINFTDKRYEHFVDLNGYEREDVGENKNGVYVPQKKILVVKGQEVPTKQGHLLVLGLGYDRHIKENKSLENTLKEVRDKRAIAVADHPFYLSGIGHYLKRNPKIIEEIDAIEIHNGEASFGFSFGPLPNNANELAQEFYREIKSEFPCLGALSSSDGHSIYEIGKNWTEIDMPDIANKGNFTNSLRNSIRNTDLKTEKKTRPLILGAIDHALDLILITKIGFKIGLKEFYIGKDRLD
jgi:hypothetical protein